MPAALRPLPTSESFDAGGLADVAVCTGAEPATASLGGNGAEGSQPAAMSTSQADQRRARRARREDAEWADEDIQAMGS